MKKKLKKACTVCGLPRKEFPMCFKGDPQCSVRCTKKAAK